MIASAVDELYSVSVIAKALRLRRVEKKLWRISAYLVKYGGEEPSELQRLRGMFLGIEQSSG